MDILCLYSVEDYYTVHKPLAAFSSIPFGISHIAAALQHAGFNVSMFVATPHRQSSDLFLRRLSAHPPRLMCATAVSTQYPLIRRYARQAKEAMPKLPIVVGGHHATLNPEDTVKEISFDAICLGEGERAIVEYASCLKRGQQPSGIPNLWIRNAQTGNLERNPPAEFLVDLDKQPFIDRTIWNDWVFDSTRMHSVLAGRGCPYSCRHCSNHALRTVGKGKYVRFRSPDNIASEIEQIVAQYSGVESIYIEAETLAADRTNALELCAHLEEFTQRTNSSVVFGTNLAPSRHVVADQELPRRLKHAHFGFVNLGLESGSERIRKEVLRRPNYTNNDIVGFSKMIRAAGLDLHLYVMMGIPGETLDDYWETIDCVRRCNPTSVYCSIFYPYPGTDLHALCRRLGLISDTSDSLADPSLERRRAILDLPGFSRARIQLEYALFPYRAFKGQKSTLAIAATIARTVLGSSSVANRAYRFATSHSQLRKFQKSFAPASR